MPPTYLHGIGRKNFTCFTFYGARSIYRFTLKSSTAALRCTCGMGLTYKRAEKPFFFTELTVTRNIFLTEILYTYYNPN
jgi:hypothetical protein